MGGKGKIGWEEAAVYHGNPISFKRSNKLNAKSNWNNKYFNFKCIVLLLLLEKNRSDSM